MITTDGERTPLSAKDRKLIGELADLTTRLDRSGVLAKMAAKRALLPSDVLEQPAELRTACLAAARDRCHQRVRALEFARLRRRLASFVMPFAFGVMSTLAVAIAGKPYVMHLLT